MGDFAAQFHGLPGTTVGEKKRSLLQLLKTHPNQTIDVTPQNHLERLFYVDSLIFYRDFEKLYANYLKNDDITVNKLRNCPWFFRHVLNMPQNFVREILPNFSFVARQKLITGASKVMTDSEADDIFDALVDRYGLAHGLRIMTQCTKAKISKIVEEYFENIVELKKPQLKALYNTSPELFEKLIRDKNSPVFLEIAKRNPDFYAKLVENNKCNKELGRRNTKNFMKTKKELVMRDVAVYFSRVLHRKQFVRMLGDNVENIYERLFAIDQSRSEIFLKLCPENKQYLFRMRVVEKQFGNFGNNHVTASFLKMVKDDELRQKLALAKYKETQKEEWWKYYSIGDCLVKVTEMLNSSSNQKKRCNLAKILAINCRNNQDYGVGFLRVLELLTKRLKNDTEFLYYFIDNLDSPYSKSIDFTKCNESHWKLLIEIVSAPDFEDCHRTSFIEIHVHYMVFLSETQQREARDNLLAAFVQKFGKQEMMDHIEFRASNGPGCRFEREFLVSMLDEADWELLQRISQYNKRNSTNPIDLFQIVKLEELLQDLESSGYESFKREIFDSLILDSELRAKWQELYWSELDESGTVKTITWYLTHDMSTFSCRFDTFLDACFGKNPGLRNDLLWRKIKCYPPLVAKLLQHLHQENSPKIFRVLAHFVNFEDYVRAFRNLKEFYASSVTSADETLKMTVIQKNNLKALRSFVKNAKILKAKPQDLLAFKDEPFVDRLPMVIHAFYNIPEGEAMPFLEEIRVGGVSTTKQALFLTCVICERKAVIKELLRNKLTQTVPQALLYFLKNPSDDVFEIVLLRLKKLDQNNADTISLVTKVYQIPKKYQPRYFETLWNLLTDTNSKSLKSRVITSCDAATLHPQQVALVFKTDFFKDFLSDFTIKFLIDNPAESAEKLELFFEHLTQFKQEHWDQMPANKDLSGFINDFAWSYLQSSIPSDALMVQFLERFKATFRDAEAFQESVELTLLLLKHKSVEDGVELVSNLIDNVVDQFSEVCLGLLFETARKVFGRQQFGFSNLAFCYNLLKFKKSANNAIMVLELLPNKEPEVREELEMYRWVMATILKFQEASVEVYLNWFFKS